MYLSEVYGAGGIYAKVVAASVSVPTGIELWTLETRAPKFIDAECITGDTLLHFERQAKPGRQCLATMSVAEFYDKWVHGITVPVANKRCELQLEKIDAERRYTFVELSRELEKYDDYVGYLTRTYKDFPGKDRSVLGVDFISWYSKKEMKNKRYTYRNILAKMCLRAYDFSSGQKTTTSVVDIWETGKKSILKITSGSYNIRVSREHLFLTMGGWKKAEDLDKGDLIYRISHLDHRGSPDKYLAFNRRIKPQVLADQNHSCCDCGCSIDTSADIHHIVPVADDFALAFERSNVVALCQRCHDDRHIALGASSTRPALYEIDNIEEDGEDITYDIQVAHEDQNFVANSFVVHNCSKHRMLSANSSSSRAVPTSKMVSWNNLYLPFDLRAAGKGMQNDVELPKWKAKLFRVYAKGLYGLVRGLLMPWQKQIHKQHLNRFLEPWTFQTKVITGTEWDNFFKLRLASGAQPEIRELARCMKEAMDQVIPARLMVGEWHLPYVTDWEEGLESQKARSVARCARVSFLNHNKQRTLLIEDLARATQLAKDEHMTPFEHQATPWDGRIRGIRGTTHLGRLDGSVWSGNLRGWVQNRQLMQGWNNGSV